MALTMESNQIILSNHTGPCDTHDEYRGLPLLCKWKREPSMGKGELLIFFPALSLWWQPHRSPTPGVMIYDAISPTPTPVTANRLAMRNLICFCNSILFCGSFHPSLSSRVHLRYNRGNSWQDCWPLLGYFIVNDWCRALIVSVCLSLKSNAICCGKGG